MNYRCANCGSESHRTFDCSKPYNGWKEREPVMARPEQQPASFTLPPVKNAPKHHQATENSVVTTYEQRYSATLTSGLSGPVPDRKSFPFLRENTRTEMDERIHKAASGTMRGDTLKATAPKVDEKPVKLPKSKQKKQANQQDLF